MIDRSTILRGPAVITWNSGTFYTKDDIKIEIGYETANLETSAYGKVDEIVKNRTVKVTATPIGAYASRAILWPYGGAAMGTSLFGATDKPLVIWTIPDGKKYTFSAAALTKMPSLKLSAVDTICGAAEWTCLGTNNTAWSGASSLEVASSAAFTDTSFATGNIVKSTYTGVWGTVAGFTSIITKDGFTVDFDLSTSPVETDTDGLVDYTLGGLAVTVKFQPLGPTVENFLAAMKIQGTGAARGMSLNAVQAASLTLSGDSTGKPEVTVTGAQIKDAALAFGLATERLGQVTFVATRTFTSGAANPLFTVGVKA